jgi:iron(II)-dependent oxidoreductase
MFDRLFKRKEKEPLPDFSEVTVTLKPILGIRPGIYLIVIYSLLILAVIFLLFFLPGLVDYGSFLNFSSAPVPAGVWIDGKKAGVTPCEVLVHEGRHEIRIGRPNYQPVVMTRDVTRFVFALPFLPKREWVDATLAVADARALARDAYADFSEWALVEEFSTAYPYPPLLTEAAKSVSADQSDDSYAALRALLERALPAVHSSELATDWLTAAFIVESKGRGLTPAALFRLLSDMRRLVARYDNLPFFLYGVLPKDLTKEAAAVGRFAVRTRYDLEKTAGFQAKVDAYRAFLARFSASRGAGPGGGLSLGGVQFLPVPSGEYLMGRYEKGGSLLGLDFLNVFPHPQRVKGFYMSRTEVTNAQFRLFLEENPDWRPENRDKLIGRRLVDEFYLKDWKSLVPPAGREGYPVTYVSAYAAEAYCAWLTGKLKAILPAATVRLPYEAEWEWAAAGGDPARFKVPGSRLYSEFSAGVRPAGTSAPNLFGLSDMAGNVFEWCRDWYALAAPLVSSSKPENNGYDRYEPFTAGGGKSVRGGSWATPDKDVESYTRGGQPPSWCTPFLGFRPVIAP